MNTKQAALTTLQQEFERWEALLSRLSEAQITDPQLPEGWSIKDVVAHLHAWQQRSIARFEAALGGHEPKYPAWPDEFDPEMEGQPNDLNGWLYAQTRDQPWAQVHQDWRAGFLRFLELGAAVPEPDLLQRGKYGWLDEYALVDVIDGTAEHHREHAEYLEPVLAQLGQ